MIHEFLMNLVDKLLENPDIESEKDVSYDEIEKIIETELESTVKLVYYSTESEIISLVSDILYSIITKDYSHRPNYSNSDILFSDLTAIEELCANIAVNGPNKTNLDEKDRKILSKYFNFPSTIMISWPIIEQADFHIYYSLNKLGLVGELDRNDEFLGKDLNARFEGINYGLKVDITSFILTCITLFKTFIIDCSMTELVSDILETNQYKIRHTGVLNRSNPGVIVSTSCLLDIVNLDEVSNDFRFQLKGALYTLKQFINAFTNELEKQLNDMAKYYRSQRKLP